MPCLFSKTLLENSKSLFFFLNKVYSIGHEFFCGAGLKFITECLVALIILIHCCTNGHVLAAKWYYRTQDLHLGESVEFCIGKFSFLASYIASSGTIYASQ